MSIIAGIYTRNRNSEISQRDCDSLRNSISRNSEDNVSSFKNANIFLLKIDIGAYQESGYLEKDGDAAMLAGQPLFSGGLLTRTEELAEIQQEFNQDNLGVLTKAQGVFSIANYQTSNHTLTLATDKLGIRPVYYWMDEKYLVFASTIRILEELAVVPKEMDVRAVTEISTLGYNLTDKTPYKKILCLKAGEILRVSEDKLAKRVYWNWDNVKVSEESEEKIVRNLYDSFELAVKSRIKDDKTTISFLSGGLDSRCNVGGLYALNVQVHTFNFARPNTQDQVLGREFANAGNFIHTEIAKLQGDNIPDYSTKIAQAWKNSDKRHTFPAEHPALIWSGEGGSVALGHVHLSKTIVDLIRDNKIDEAIAEFVARENAYISPKLLNPKIFDDVSAFLQQGIRDELNSYDPEDKARKFYLFLLLNDQRRKLANHFENIDLHRVEFHLPFFDSNFLVQILATPLDMCLRHKVYLQFLKLFPAIVTSVAWQYYPGHEPCPLPIPENLSYQWNDSYQNNEQKALKAQLIAQGKELLRKENFPGEILNKNNFRLALWLHSLGLRDYGYLIETAAIYQKYWRICKDSSPL